MTRLCDMLLSATLLAIFCPNLAAAETPTISTRIVGGETSDSGEWPAIVSLKGKYTSKHFCGGTLIAQQWVLTAAHCVFDYQDLLVSSSDITATVGEYNLKSIPATPSTKIEQIFTHPDYDSITQANDIALLKLSTPLAKETVTMLDLQSTLESIALQHPVTALGWGSTVATADGLPASYPDILREVEVRLFTDQECTESLGKNYTKEMICAGVPEGGKDACQGDSGGPLMVMSNGGGQQIGIVSWGVGCASPEAPGVYTRLALYSDWINSISKTMSITTSTEFLFIAIGNSDSKQITVDNNSDSDASFTYEIEGSEYFSFNAAACEIIAANSTCQFPVTYTPLDDTAHQATITVESTITDADIQTSELSGVAYIPCSSSSGSVGFFTFLLIPLLFLRRYQA